MQNLLQDECIVQLYLKPINAFLGINKLGKIISTANFSNSESELFIIVQSIYTKVYNLSNYVYEIFMWKYVPVSETLATFNVEMW